MTVVILDTETTGLAHDDHIWEFAAIRVEPDVVTAWQFFIRHDLDKAKALPDSFRVDHDTRYNPAVAITPRELVCDVLPPVFADRPHVIGAVPNFDTERLSRLLRHHGHPDQPWHYHLRDVETIAVGYLLGRMAMGDEQATLALVNVDDSNALSRAVGVEPPGEGVRHTAMGDCEWAWAVWRAVTGGRVNG